MSFFLNSAGLVDANSINPSPKKRKLYHENANEHLKLEIDQYIRNQLEHIHASYAAHVHRMNIEIQELKIKVERLEQTQTASKGSRPISTSDKVQCIICLDDCKSPAILIPCGHTYCEGCIETWLLENEACPSCRTAVSNFQKIYV
eukprot:NODE_476_length_7980_cov_0.328258.p6 type:complete len:146 gc:universal NODE_476_length_7980_cov_0.328258:5022-4585(-)